MGLIGNGNRSQFIGGEIVSLSAFIKFPLRKYTAITLRYRLRVHSRIDTQEVLRQFSGIFDPPID